MFSMVLPAVSRVFALALEVFFLVFLSFRSLLWSFS